MREQHHRVSPDLSVVLPTYNEAGHIAGLVRMVASSLQAAGLTHETIVVDDDSPDGTANVVTAEFQEDPRVILLRRVEDWGLGNAIGHGVAASRGRVVAVLDADFNHDPRLIPVMFAMLREVDFVIGSRFVRGGGMPDRRRYWASYAFNLLVRSLVRTRVHDNLSGFFAARGDWLRSVEAHTVFYGYGDYFMRLISLARSGKLRICELPVTYGVRPTGVSKTSFVRTPIRYLAAASRLALRVDRPRVNDPRATRIVPGSSPSS